MVTALWIMLGFLVLSGVLNVYQYFDADIKRLDCSRSLLQVATLKRDQEQLVATRCLQLRTQAKMLERENGDLTKRLRAMESLCDLSIPLESE